MCGICGYVDYHSEIDQAVINRMLDLLRHRGPNDFGSEIIVGNDFQLFLGHDRLSILDLSSAGHQPMTYRDLIIVYNGEIYNFRDIRRELSLLNHEFFTECDTEVILHAFDEWGYECVNKFIGMFAFAIYDKSKRCISICRDRAGVKPLYYYNKGNSFGFSSELKALMCIPGFDKSIKKQSLGDIFQYSYIPMENTIFEHVYKVLPGYWLKIDLNTHKIERWKYWDIQDYYKKEKLDISYNEAQEELLDLLKSSLAYRMVADVPVGVFLSGGYDSVLTASILKKELGYDIDTFTIGFLEGNNEAPIAEKVSELLGTKHHTRYCTSRDAIELIPKLPYYYDDPYNNPGSIAFLLVSELAKKNVTVALSADGADEILGGYAYYDQLFGEFQKEKLISNIVPDVFKSGVMNVYRFLNDRKIVNRGAGFINRICSNNLNQKEYVFSRIGHNEKRIKSIYPDYHFSHPHEIFSDINAIENSSEFWMLFDFKALMVDNYIVKIERGSMACSLECRAPMLDHRLVEFCAQLPTKYKIDRNGRKKILRELVYRYVPKSIIDKPKTGFTVPWTSWLRNDLRDYVYDTLTTKNLQDAGFNAQATKEVVDRFMTEEKDAGLLWCILQYVAWYKLWVG